jgi:hypothetical protein
MLKKPMDPNFEPIRSIGFNGHHPSKVPKFKYRHDGTLSNRNFTLNNFSYLSTDQQPKNVLPTSVVHGIGYLFLTHDFLVSFPKPLTGRSQKTAQPWQVMFAYYV